MVMIEGGERAGNKFRDLRYIVNSNAGSRNRFLKMYGTSEGSAHEYLLFGSQGAHWILLDSPIRHRENALNARQGVVIFSQDSGAFLLVGSDMDILISNFSR